MTIAFCTKCCSMFPWDGFERLVEEHEADKHVRQLTTKSQLVALLYGQLSGASSLREIVSGLQSHKGAALPSGAHPARAVRTLADANALRPVEVFGGLFALLMAQAHRGLRRALWQTTYLIDFPPRSSWTRAAPTGRASRTRSAAPSCT